MFKPVERTKRRIKAVPVDGTWEEFYEDIKKNRKPYRKVTLRLQLTPDLFDHIHDYYDNFKWIYKENMLSTDVWLDEDGNIHILECVQQNYGDDDGYGVEPDNYMSGIIGPDGYFIVPLHVR